MDIIKQIEELIFKSHDEKVLHSIYMDEDRYEHMRQYLLNRMPAPKDTEVHYTSYKNLHIFVVKNSKDHLVVY